MIFPPVDRNPSAKTLHQFGWMVGGAFALIGLVVGFFSKRPFEVFSLSMSLVGLGISLFVISLISLHVTRLLYLGWMLGTRPIGLVVGIVMLTLMYFVLMLPFALLIRRKDPMRTRPGSASFWEPCKHAEPTLERMRKLF